ncbi:phage integrase family protein [Vibrio ichthyoenteri ATCC 700023]|uniref:Phage integrase family protein n=1 Tax=Vibrio ichthyoenteri ATCC 700023 TaxID=870968 RepID=F9S0X6_9VIBR|nr:tyrosine-type recombinase/integrase [Vibrio ichthyoenteri]EGU42959.1 phage integrase family protein [Vibrio ichthyoenteri ATCC 700023]
MIVTNESGFFSSYAPEQVFTRKRDAAQLDKRLELQSKRENVNKDYRTLDELIAIWYRMHGKTLSDHIRLRKLLYRISESLGNPIGSDLTSEMFAKYREKRTLEVSLKTVNREHSYLRAVFNELDRLGVITFDNPLTKIRQFRESECELRFLSHDEITRLLEQCRKSTNKSLIHLVKICLATGARWGEAENLKPSQIANGQITYLNTKSKKNRTVPINEILFNELMDVEPYSNNRKFIGALAAFRSALARAEIDLPAGQNTHVLRHTFASHYVMGGGNIVKLRDVLGHKEITTTMRYAHLAPDHLEDALKLNPLNMHQ